MTYSLDIIESWIKGGEVHINISIVSELCQALRTLESENKDLHRELMLLKEKHEGRDYQE